MGHIEWLVGDVPFYLTFWVELPHPGSTSSSAITEKPRCSVGQFWVAITPYSADRPISIKSNQIEIID